MSQYISTFCHSATCLECSRVLALVRRMNALGIPKRPTDRNASLLWGNSGVLRIFSATT